MNTKVVEHPQLPVRLTFRDADHSYTDDAGAVYESVTTVVKKAFPPFDEEAAAARVAEREKRLEIEILADWRVKRTMAATYGTKVHAYAEACINGVATPAAGNPQETRAFRLVDKALVMLAKVYEFLPPEQIVFDPLFKVAGTVDLPAVNRETGALAVLDWKTSEDITSDAWGRVALDPIRHVPDSKVHHYSLQLSIYAWILTDPEFSAYPSKGQPVEMALIHLPPVGSEPVWRPCVDLRKEAGMLMQRAT